MRANDRVFADPAKPDRIRFVINGDPGLKKYPEILDSKIPMHEKIKEGMRRHAADVLREKGWCVNGFTGPDIVWAKESARLTSNFFVDCIQ